MTSGERKNLVLIGYRGAGKTTVGRAVAERLALAFVDTDEQIVAEAGVSIADIFAEHGEPEFRRREAAVVQCVAGQGGQVISAGGGAILRDDNVEALRRTGVVVWLAAPPELLWERIRGDESTAANRPALSDRIGLEEVRVILAQRELRYRQAAHAVVDASDENVDRVVEAVLAVYDSPTSSSSSEG
jgi:shikimate kinase